MRLIPVTLKQAKAFVKAHHRHHPPMTGWKFGVGLEYEGKFAGVAVAGRPNARMTQLNEPQTAEMTRGCTLGTRNACSFLYGAICRAAFALGYNKVITFTLPKEGGASLKAAGFTFVDETDGGTWDRPSRKRDDNHPLEKKWKWQRLAS